MNIYEKITKIRKDNNLSQEEFAEILNVSRQTVSNWENNKCYHDIETLIVISSKFNISLDDLLKNDIKAVRNIDKKIRLNKKLKFIIIFIIIISIIVFSILHLNYKKKINNLQDKFTNIENDNSVISIDTNNITNIDDIKTNDKYIDIFIDDHDIDYSNETPISIYSKIIKNKDGCLAISVTEDEYIAINKALVDGYKLKVKINNF